MMYPRHVDDTLASANVVTGCDDSPFSQFVPVDAVVSFPYICELDSKLKAERRLEKSLQTTHGDVL